MNHTTLLIKQFLKRQIVGNRKSAPRFDACAIANLKSINQVGGSKVKLINIARNGALIESRKRISPQSSISLRIATVEAVHIVKGKVIHYSIHSRKGKEVQYQFAIAFEEDFAILPAGTDEGFTVSHAGIGAAC